MKEGEVKLPLLHRLCVRVCLYACVCVCVLVCVSIYVCAHVCMCVVCARVFSSTCVYVCVCTCMCVCVHVGVCVYSCAYSNRNCDSGLYRQKYGERLQTWMPLPCGTASVRADPFTPLLAISPGGWRVGVSVLS